MDNENKNLDLPGNDNWLDDILGTSDTAKELGPDELAVQAAGLTHPNDLELEKILAEDWDSVPDLEPAVPQPPMEPVPEAPFPTPAFETDNDFEIDLSQDELFRDDFPKENDLEITPEELSAIAATDAVVNEPAPAVEDATTQIPVEQVTSGETPQQRTQYYAPIAETQVVPPQPTEVQVPEDAGKEKAKERKIRPKFKKGYGLFGIPHILSTGIWLVIILVIGLTIGNLLWVCTSDLMAFGKPDQQITITITEKEIQVHEDGSKSVDIDAISKKLGDAGLIKYPNLFKLFANITNKSQDIDPGTYTLNSKYDYNAMINNMSVQQAAREQVDILIPEGYTCAQIFKLLEENGVCTVAELEAYMVEVGRDGMDGDYELEGYWFLEGAPRADKYWLEGYMFPDTYRFYLDDEPANVVKKFMDGFDYRFTDIMHNKLENMQERTGLDLSIRDVVIIASMIEKETADGAESYDISSVIFNRLRNPSNFPYLNIDATLIYALHGNVDPETGLTKPLTEEDLKMDHPYNTYNNRGLPPGAISNPGRNSLDAALSPTEDTGYHYYVYNPHEGKHMFAATLAEHERNIAYINSLD